MNVIISVLLASILFSALLSQTVNAEDNSLTPEPIIQDNLIIIQEDTVLLGKLIISENQTLELTENAILSFTSGDIIDNFGIINNHGIINMDQKSPDGLDTTNPSKIPEAKINNHGTFNNSGVLNIGKHIGSGVISHLTNSGTIINDGEINNSSLIDNIGVLENHGTITHDAHRKAGYAYFANEGVIINHGDFSLDDMLSLKEGSSVENFGSMDWSTRGMDMEGEFYNHGTLSFHDASLTVTEPGIFVNEGDVDFSYQELRNEGGKVINNKKITLGAYGSISNTGLFENNGSIITSNEIEPSIINNGLVYHPDLSPIKQANIGVAPNDIECGRYHKLVLDAERIRSICIFEDSIEKFISRGWIEG